MFQAEGAGSAEEAALEIQHRACDPLSVIQKITFLCTEPQRRRREGTMRPNVNKCAPGSRLAVLGILSAPALSLGLNHFPAPRPQPRQIEKPEEIT